MEPVYVFDVDGVIMDRMPILARIFAESLESHNVPYDVARKHMLTTGGRTTEDQYIDMLTAYGVLKPPVDKSNGLVQKLSNYFRENCYVETPQLLPDALPALELLKGRTMVMSTNAPQEALDRDARHHELNPFFTAWFGRGYNGITNKADHNRSIQEKLGISDEEFRSRGVLIGDGAPDMKIAIKWGIKPIGRPTEFVKESDLHDAGAVACVYDLRDLRQLVELEKTLF